MRKFNIAFHGLQFNGIGIILELRLRIKQGKNLFGRSKRRLQPVKLLRQALNRVKELGNIHVKGYDRTASDRLPQPMRILDITPAAQIQQTEDRGHVQHIHDRPENSENKNLLLFCPTQFSVLLIKFLLLLILPVENLNDFHAGQILRQEGIDIRGSVLHLTICLPRKLPENNRKHNNKRNKAQHHQRQGVVHADHRYQNADNDKAVLNQIYNDVREHHGNCIGIIRNTRDKLADRDAVELVLRQAFNMRKKILADFGNDSLSGLLQDNGLNIGAGQGEQQNAGVNYYPPDQLRHGKAVLDHLFNITDDQRRNDVIGNRKHHDQQNQHKTFPIRPSVSQQPARNFAVLHIAVKADGLPAAAKRQIR